VSIYQVQGSQHWDVGVWDRDEKRYIVKGNGERSVIAAGEVAQDYALSLLKIERTAVRSR
jgi:hypothetical protein